MEIRFKEKDVIEVERAKRIIQDMTTLEQVAEFHRAFGVKIEDSPKVDDADIALLRGDLLEEELNELNDALDAQDKLATLDALIDLQYVLDGAFLALGFHKVKDEAFAEVHKANMRKLGTDSKPRFRSDGKILKPKDWVAPDLSKFV